LETPIVSIAPSSKDARIAAALYFACLIMGVVRAIYIPLSLFFPGNAAALILQHEPTFRFAMLTELTVAALMVVVALAFYRLLASVNCARLAITICVERHNNSVLNIQSALFTGNFGCTSPVTA